jgi:hypothetical protein
LGISGSSLNLRYAAFNGPGNDGSNAGIRLSQTIMGVNSVDFGYSEYRYSLSGAGEQRVNKTWEGSCYAAVTRHWFLTGIFQLESGDDNKGNSLRCEIGYRL